MQERRTTIRYDCTERAQYCPSDELVPRDGRMTNISERGLGLLAHEAHRPGERIAVTFLLPGEEEAVTTTGVVRWCGASPVRRRWYPLGLEWLPLEPTTRYRIEAYLKSRQRREATRPPFWRVAQTTRSASAARFWPWVAVLCSALVAAGLAWYAVRLRAENVRLSQGLAESSAQAQAAGGQLAREQELSQSLQAATAQLATTRLEVSQLGAQSAQFENRIMELGQEMGRFQTAYAAVRDEREQLVQRVAELEAARGELERRLTSLPELQWAIEDAVAARKQREQLERANQRAAIERRRTRQVGVGNRGYLIRDGSPTSRRQAVEVEVVIHEPEASAASGKASFTIPSVVP